MRPIVRFCRLSEDTAVLREHFLPGRVFLFSAAVFLIAVWLACTPRPRISVDSETTYSSSVPDTTAVTGPSDVGEASERAKKTSFTRRYDLAKHLISIGELKEAASHLRRLRRLARSGLEKAMVNEARASLYLARGELRRAEEHATKALNARPSFARAHRTRAIIRKERGDLPGAIDDFKSALALLPEDNESLRGLAETYLAQERVSSALRVLDRLLEVEPLDAWAQDNWCASMASLLGYSEFPLAYLRALRSDAVTRGEFAAFLVVEREMSLLDTVDGNSEERGEVRENGEQAEFLPGVPDCGMLWFEAFVEKVVEWGAMRLYPDGTFRPWDPVRKGPLAVELYRFLSTHCAVSPTTFLSIKSESLAESEEITAFRQLDSSGYLDVGGSSYLWIPVTSLVKMDVMSSDSDVVFGAQSTLGGAEARTVARKMARAMSFLRCGRID